MSGSDNAPHRPGISAYPHPHHRAGRAAAPSVGSLADILELLVAQLL